MKKNHISEAVQFLLISATVLITCALIALGIYIATSSQALSRTVNTQITSLNDELSVSDIIKYDGLDVKGSDVTNFIKKYLGGYTITETGPFTVSVETKTGITSHVNKEYLDQITNFTTMYYVNPLAKFKGAVIKNENDVIVKVKFVQQ